MALRDVLLQHSIAGHLRRAQGALLVQAWATLSPVEQANLVRILLDNPKEGGIQLRELITAVIQGKAISDVDLLLTQPEIPVTDLEDIFN